MIQRRDPPIDTQALLELGLSPRDLELLTGQQHFAIPAPPRDIPPTFWHIIAFKLAILTLALAMILLGIL